MDPLLVLYLVSLCAHWLFGLIATGWMLNHSPTPGLYLLFGIWFGLIPFILYPMVLVGVLAGLVIRGVSLIRKKREKRYEHVPQAMSRPS